MLLMRHGRKTCHTTGDYKCRVDSYGSWQDNEPADMCSYSRWFGSEHELLLVDNHLNLVGTIDLILLR
jgi:hypothetical protein